MRRARFCYVGSLHHVMNRGIKGENIFPDDDAKSYFLKLLTIKAHDRRIKVLSYCIMDNHYHLILQNTSGKLSDFMKQLNGGYGFYYRERVGGKGYVFQSRFKSTLIENEKYLRIAILYVLLNPSRKLIAKSPWDYGWSSIREYFKNKVSGLIDCAYVEELFESMENLSHQLSEMSAIELPIIKTRMGEIMGDKTFIETAFQRSDRRQKKNANVPQKLRIKDYSFEPPNKVIEVFEEKIGKKIMDLDVNSRKEKDLRLELLVLLKDRAGLNYTKIIKHPLFRNIKYSSMSQMYKRKKSKMLGKGRN